MTTNILSLPTPLLTTVVQYAPPHTIPTFLNTCKQLHSFDTNEFWTSVYYKWFGSKPRVKKSTPKKECVRLSLALKDWEQRLDEFREKDLNSALSGTEIKEIHENSVEVESAPEKKTHDHESDSDHKEVVKESDDNCEPEREGEDGVEEDEDASSEESEDDDHHGHDHGHDHEHDDDFTGPKDDYEACGIDYWFWAVTNGLLRVVESLLSRKRPRGMLLPGIDVTDSSRNTALHRSSTTMVTWLVKNGANTELRDMSGFTPITKAADEGRIRTVDALISLGADINSTVKKMGCTCGMASFLEQAFGVGGSVVKGSATSLWIAARRGYLEIVELLLSHKADMELPAVGGSTPLYIALRNKHMDVAAALVKANANINSVAEESGMIVPALYTSVELENVEAIKFILAVPGVDINLANQRGTTPLYVACQAGYFEIVKLLVEAGANVMCRRVTGATPLLISTIYKHVDVALYLLEHGALANDQALDGETPLFAAVEAKSLKLVKAFINAGADPNVQSKVYPLELAIQEKQFKIITFLLASKANPALLPGKVQRQLQRLLKAKLNN